MSNALWDWRKPVSSHQYYVFLSSFTKSAFFSSAIKKLYIITRERSVREDNRDCCNFEKKKQFARYAWNLQISF